MRVFKTGSEVLLSNTMPAPVKVIGNVLMLGTVVGGSGGSLISAANQSPLAFSTFHWQVGAIFVLELVVWEAFSTITQVIYCSLLVKFHGGPLLKKLANPIVLFHIDGHGLK
jgi:hypothetical protein